MTKSNKRNDDIYDIIAANIKINRKNANITQAELADLASFSHEFIRRIEAPNGKKYFSIDTLVQIAKALNVKMEDLFVGIDSMNLKQRIEEENRNKKI